MNFIHKEFLIALANGEEVEFKYRGSWESIESSKCLGIFGNAAFEFRIKPKTVTLSMEIPMPFVPQVGEIYWYFDPDYIRGVNQYEKDNCVIEDRIVASGVYRTEDEALQALAAHEAAIAKLLECAK